MTSVWWLHDGFPYEKNKPENPFQTMMEQRRLIKLKPILKTIYVFKTFVDIKNKVFGEPDSGQKTRLCIQESLGAAILRGIIKSSWFEST